MRYNSFKQTMYFKNVTLEIWMKLFFFRLDEEKTFHQGFVSPYIIIIYDFELTFLDVGTKIE